MAESGKQSKLSSIYKHNASIVKVLGACILVCAVFFAGFLVRGNDQLLQALGFSDINVSEDQNAGMTVTGNTYDSISARVAEVEGTLSQESLDTYDLNTATKAVLDSFLASAGDPYLRYFDEQSYQAYLSNAAHADSGVGVLFGEIEGECYVFDVFENSEAALAGVHEGDSIVSIDGSEQDTWSMPDVVNALSRDDGQSVFITWQRSNDDPLNPGEIYSTNLIYTASTATNIHSSVDGSVLYIEISQLASDSSSVVRQVIENNASGDISGIILDLRDIPGGYLTQAVDIASLFISSGTVVQIQTNDNVTTKSADGQSITQLPLVVLVNERTSGSAEVLAAALQESGRATVVGQTTQGKGSVQVMQPLSFGGALRYTAATYLTAAGRAIDGAGVYPDVEVASQESQYEVAYELALAHSER